MNISNFLRDLLCAGTLYPLIKPDIVFENYFFVWDDKSLGLYSNEIVKFKNFIKNMIPHLETMMKVLDISSSTLSAKDDPAKKMIFNKGKLSITDKYNNHIYFILNIDNN